MEGEKACIDLHTITFPNPVDKYVVIVTEGPATQTCCMYQEPSSFRSRLINTYDYPSGNINFIYGLSATHNAIETTVQSMVDIADNNDKIVFFYSGHGVRESGNDGYVETKTTHIYDHELVDWLEGSQSSSIFVYIGACFSGTFIDDFENSASKSKFFVTTASTSSQTHFDLHGITWSKPSVMGSPTKPTAVRVIYHMAWYYFLGSKLSSSRSMDTAFSDAISNYHTTYEKIPRYEVTITGFSNGWFTGYWVSYSDAWDWDNPGSDTGPLKGGYPQMMDGISNSAFYL